MSERIGPPPQERISPVWIWYRWEGKRGKSGSGKLDSLDN
jgi:hypothetical protein